MADQTERTPRRGMTFPFLLSLLILVAVLADLWLSERGFIVSAAWRQQPWILTGTALLGFLLWLWVLVAARRRSMRFEGPVETTRGSNGALQPILATVFLVVGLNLAYTHTLPKWLNGFVAEDVHTEDLIVAGDVAAHRAGCSRAPARNPRFGDVKLCLPESVADLVRGQPESVVVVEGPASWFGLEPHRYALAAEEPIIPAELIVQPAGDSVPLADTDPAITPRMSCNLSTSCSTPSSAKTATDLRTAASSRATVAMGDEAPDAQGPAEAAQPRCEIAQRGPVPAQSRGRPQGLQAPTETQARSYAGPRDGQKTMIYQHRRKINLNQDNYREWAIINRISSIMIATA